MGKQSVFTTIRYALLNHRVSVYGIVDSFERSNGTLLVQLRVFFEQTTLILSLQDETGKLEIVVDKKSVAVFKNLQRGDILRCFHLKVTLLSL